jgi:catechol 2,3-dioxygenase-like lactoylglutathione lyase family enzyme
LPAVTTVARAAESVPAPPPEIVSTLLRVALVVRDVEASKRFYTYALGYEVSFEGDITRPAVVAQLGLEPGQRASFVVLRSSQVIKGQKRDGAMIGLLSVTDPTPPAMQRPEGADLAVGEAMMAVVTSDIGRVHARLRELGARILVEPMKSPDGREIELVVRDPDGVRVHVVERLEGT